VFHLAPKVSLTTCLRRSAMERPVQLTQLQLGTAQLYSLDVRTRAAPPPPPPLHTTSACVEAVWSRTSEAHAGAVVGMATWSQGDDSKALSCLLELVRHARSLLGPTPSPGGALEGRTLNASISTLGHRSTVLATGPGPLQPLSKARGMLPSNPTPDLSPLTGRGGGCQSTSSTTKAAHPAMLHAGHALLLHGKVTPPAAGQSRSTPKQVWWWLTRIQRAHRRGT
jgi:hypothetical protein